MTTNPVAEVYAEALFALGIERDLRPQLHAELEDLCQILSANPDFRVFLEAPGISREDKLRVAEQVLAPDFSELFRNFVCVVIDKHRIGLIDQIRFAFQTLGDDAAERLRAEVTSAQPLPQERLDRIVELIKERTGSREVVLTPRVNPELIGGLVIRIGDTRVDSSIRTRLDTVRHRLASHGGLI